MSALAVLFVYHEDGHTTADPFEERTGDDRKFFTNLPDVEIDPQFRAEALWESIKDDFPKALHAIALNEEARLKMGYRRMRAMGFNHEDALGSLS